MKGSWRAIGVAQWGAEVITVQDLPSPLAAYAQPDHGPAGDGGSSWMRVALRNFLRRIFLSIGVILALTWSWAVQAQDGPPIGPDDRPVLQISSGGGMLALGHPAAYIPDLTIWASGRVVFEAPDQVIREGRLSAGTVTALLARAAVLYQLQDNYSACACTDVGTTSFTIDAERGRKTVSVYGFGREPWSGEQRFEGIDELRALHGAARDALPRDAPVMRPSEVVVRIRPLDRREVEHLGDAGIQPGVWPPDLTGSLSGDAARRAAELRGLGPTTGVFRLNGELVNVLVLPVLPLLATWGAEELPVHPAATAYIGNRDQATLYRAPGVAQSDLYAWYREAMPTAGWRQTGGREPEVQAWLRGQGARGSNEQVAIFRFGAERLTVERHWISSIPADGVIFPPNAFTGRDCPTDVCLRGLAPAEAAAWYREYLGYQGWIEVGPNTYIRRSPNEIGTTAGYRELRLELRPAAGGTEVSLARGPAWAPATGWPVPPPEEHSPLCEATRGGTVEIAGRSIALPETLCVTLMQQARIRIQVAYGDSFVDIDPDSGRALRATTQRQERALFGHLETVAGGRLPRGIAFPLPPF
jgi:hypothetical protein